MKEYGHTKQNEIAYYIIHGKNNVFPQILIRQFARMAYNRGIKRKISSSVVIVTRIWIHIAMWVFFLPN